MTLIGTILAVCDVQAAIGALIALVNILRFGCSHCATTPFVRVTSEPAPLGRWPVHLCPVIDESGRAHIEIYTDPAVITDICDWIAREDVERSRRT